MYLALYFPHLALELMEQSTLPLAIAQGKHIHLANDMAQQYGIQTGMDSHGAYALCGALILHQYNEQQIHAALERVANACLHFTSQVHIETHGLILEVSGSIKLFSGLTPLLQQIKCYLHKLDYRYQYALAPTPMAAWWLAQANQSCVASKDNLGEHLAPLPISVSGLRPQEIESLHKAGLKSLGQCLALPYYALRQRFAPFALLLEKAMGRIRDIRPLYQAPEFFQAHLPFSYAVDHSQALLFPLQRLVLELCAYLATRGLGINQLKVYFHHENRQRSLLTLNMLHSSRNGNHILTLLRERLEHYPLAQSIEALELEAKNFFPLKPEHSSLFKQQDQRQTECTQLLERLQTRLGADSVQGLGVLPDYRPEYSSHLHNIKQQSRKADKFPAKARPLWILASPLPLGQQANWHGPLRLFGNAERIETGWWDDHPVQRDYYVAQTYKYNTLVWIFQDAKGWFLHGFFA